MNTSARIVAALAWLAGALGAQSPQAVVLEGQALPGGGTVTGIRFVHIDAWEGWLVHVTTDQPLSPSAALRQYPTWSSAVVWKQVGDPAPYMPGFQIAAFDSFTSDVLGSVAWNARLRNSAGGGIDAQVLYIESTPWLETGPIASWLWNDFPQGTEWVSFDDVRLTAQDGSVMLRGRVDDPFVAGTDESFLATGAQCGSWGVLCDVERLAQEGLSAAGTGQLIESVRLAPGAAAMAPLTQPTRIVWSCDLDGPVTSDGCVYSYTPQSGHVLLAQEGMPSTVPGRLWGPLEDLGLDVNAAGAWTLRASLDASDLASDALIVKSGTVLVREGDSLPAIAPFVLESFGRGRARLDQSGHVVWYGHWLEHGQSSEALFRDHELLVRTGHTTIGGQLLVDLSSGPDELALTPQGDLLLFKGVLAGGLEGAFALPLGP